ncbi:ankyrin repeat-containing domain protein, partial [Baffinella frigidus]
DVPLWLAAGVEPVDAVHELLLSGAINIEHGYMGSTPLMNAATEGQTETVKLLITKGADRFFVKKSTGDTLLHLAAAYDRYETVAYLLSLPEPGIDTRNKSGYSALSYSASRSDITIVKMLLDHGATVDTLTCMGETPLMSACAAGRVEVASLFLDRGANVSSVTEGGVGVLYGAIDNGGFGVGDGTRFEIVKFLLAHGVVDINATTDDGSTPLHAAVSSGDRFVVETLLARGADTNATDDQNLDPLGVAVQG